MPGFALQDVGKRFGQAEAVSDLSLTVSQGEFVVILGPSGCGKTTTLRMIAGLERPDAGSISIGERVVSAADRFVRPEDRAIGMVFQSYAIWPHMTVFENVAYPLRVRRVPMPKRRARVAETLELVGLAGQERRPATLLSGGQMQRVALARALVADPALLLFDEPLSNLDLKLRERLRLELKALQRRTGLTSLYVTHDQAEAVELADRIVVMERGRIVQQGRPQELYRDPHSRFVAGFIASANILPATVLGAAGPGSARIRTPFGFELEARHNGPVPAGIAVDVMIHPEDCRLDPPGAGEGHLVDVLHSRFQGTSTRYTVALYGEQFDVIVLGTDEALPPGSPALLRIAPGRARIIATA